MRKSKSKRFKPGIPPPKVTPNLNKRISTGEAISFVAERIKKDTDDWRSVRNKITQRVAYAIRNKQLLANEHGIVFRNLLDWAQSKDEWEGKFADFPRNIRTIQSDQFGMSDSVSVDVLPRSLERSHAVIQTLERQLEETDRQLQQCRKEREQYRLKAEKYDAICAKNRKNGGKHEM